MTRASDAARNTTGPGSEAGGVPNGQNSGVGSAKASAAAKSAPPPGPAAAPSGPSAARPSSSPVPAGPPASAPPRMRPPLPGPPPGMRMPGPPLPGGFRYAPPPAPRRRLDGAQRGRLFGIVLSLVLVGALFGFMVSLAVPTRYGAITTIMYNVAGENTGDFLKSDRDLTTQTVLLTSRNVLQPVAQQNGIDPDDLTKNTTATVLQSSNVIQLEVKDETADGAVTLANAIAKQYLTASNASSPKGFVQGQLADVQKQLTNPPITGNTPANTAALQARQAALQSQLDQMNLTSNQSTVLVPAYPLAKPVSPSGGGSALAGLICGLVIAIVTVITLSRRWTRS